MSAVAYVSIIVIVALAILCCRRAPPRKHNVEKPQVRFDETECSMCLEEIKSETQASCGHCFCGKAKSAGCILSVWEHRGGKINCPMCRRPVPLLYPNFEESDEESSKLMLEISRYNCFFSSDERIVLPT
jgi:hypothetical protein